MFAPLAGYKTYIAAVIACAGALLGALDGDVTWAQASAIITPAVIGAAVRHGLSTTVAALLPSIIDALAKAADQTGKKAGLLIAGLLATLALSACGLTAQQIQTDITTGIQAACLDVNAAAKANPASPVLTYAQASCGSAEAMASLAQGSATVQWLGQLQQQLQQAAPAAAPAAPAGKA